MYETWCNTCLTNTSRNLNPKRVIDKAVVQNVSVESNIDEIGGKAFDAASLDKIDKKRKFEVE